MIKLIHGNCLEKMKDIEDNSIDLILTDPPYGTTKCKWDSLINLDLMWEQIKRVTKKNAPIVLFSAQPFSSALVMSNPKMFRYEWIWEKTNATGFLNSKKMPMKAHENIMVFYKKLPTYNPQFTHGHKRKKSTKHDVVSACYGKAFKTTHYDSTSRYPRSVQKFSSAKQRERKIHDTPKPPELTSYLIKTYSNKDDAVLDFCMGSGTTIIESFYLQRNVTGIEDDKEIFDRAEKRINNHCMQTRII